jgi:hypothetical protein
MPLKYNQINVSVNGANILAQSVNISETALIKPVFNLNNNNPYNSLPTKLSSNILIDYFMEPNLEVNYSIVTGSIFDKTVSLPSIINIGNCYITGYLSSFQFSLLPNALVKASAGYNVYYPFTGNLSKQLSTDSSNYDLNNSSGIAHYWSAQFLSGNSVVSNNNILQMDYAASLQLIPIYGVGSYIPTQIFYNGVQETVTILTEQQTNPQFSGLLLDTVLASTQTLNLKNISSVWSNNINNSISIPLTGFYLEEMRPEMGLDNLVFFNMKFSRYN